MTTEFETNRSMTKGNRMKARMNVSGLWLVVLALLGSLTLAKAYYDPSAQRWLNRDPLGEPGFELLKQSDERSQSDGPNLYLFVENNSVNSLDRWGNDVFFPGNINCLGYAVDFGSYLSPTPNKQSLKSLLESYGWHCSGPTKRKCKAKKDEKVIAVYIYDTSGFPPKADPFSSPWQPDADFHAIKQCPDKQWRYIPRICPDNTQPSVTPKPNDPDSYPWPGKTVPKQRYCCTKKA